MKPFRIIVTGSRDWFNQDWIVRALDSAVRGVEGRPWVIIQGGAKGADAIAAEYATKCRWPVETFEADWKREGKSAGPKRNRRMLEAGANLVLAFPIGLRPTSPGTWDCIEAAVERCIPVRIFPGG